MRICINLRAIFALLGFFLLANVAGAQELTSTNFKVADPVVFPGGYSTSDTFKLTSVISQLVTGTSSTGSTFNINSGFLFFPAVTTPSLSATAGNAEVALSWTSATGVLGWTVSSYIVGQSTVSGGPYTYTDVGAVTSSTRTGLTNGTLYYFVVRPADAFGYGIGTSSQNSATPVAPSPSPPPPSPSPSPSGGGGGGGGGGGAVVSGAATVMFSGRAYPKSSVTLLKDAAVAASSFAGSDTEFAFLLNNVTPGTYIFSLYSEDSQGRRSSLQTFPVSLTAGATTNVTGIFIAPTIAVDKSEVKKGDNIAIFGQTIPSAEVVISVNSEHELFVKTPADKNGIYLYNLDTVDLEYGQHFTKSKAASANAISAFSKSVGFAVGTKNVAALPEAKSSVIKGDMNGDGKVNLVDFSVVAYWWNRVLTATAKVNVDDKLYPDGKITLRDFSILAYYWTG
ncbi:MAG: dockerin type I repeat-containing protein [Patescibacteria group bacterium]